MYKPLTPGTWVQHVRWSCTHQVRHVRILLLRMYGCCLFIIRRCVCPLKTSPCLLLAVYLITMQLKVCVSKCQFHNKHFHCKLQLWRIVQVFYIPVFSINDNSWMFCFMKSQYTSGWKRFSYCYCIRKQIGHFPVSPLSTLNTDITKLSKCRRDMSLSR